MLDETVDRCHPANVGGCFEASVGFVGDVVCLALRSEVICREKENSDEVGMVKEDQLNNLLGTPLQTQS